MKKLLGVAALLLVLIILYSIVEDNHYGERQESRQEAACQLSQR